MLTDMANLTITVPDDLLRRARARAAREGTSVNSILRTELTHYADDDLEVAQAWDRFLAVAEAAKGRSVDGRRQWHREELQRHADVR